MSTPRFLEVITFCLGLAALSHTSSAQSANLVARYALDGSSSDSSGHGYDGVNTDMTFVVDGVRGMVASFNGTTSSIDISSTGFLYSLGDIPHGQFSVSFWILPTVDFGTTSNPNALIIMGGSSPGKGVIEIVGDTSWQGMGGSSAWGGIGINSGAGGGKTGNVVAVDMYDGNWHHVVIQWAGDPSTDAAVWVDNTVATTYGNGYNGNSDATTTLRLGGPAIWSDGGAPDKYYEGLMSNVQFFDGQLTASEVNDLYLESGIGTNYCIGAANSVGAGARIFGGGSESVAANDLMLHSSPVPNQPGLFFYGSTQVQLPFGHGHLCVSGGLNLLYPPVLGVLNQATQAVDYSILPASGQISAGSTWNFQYWYRDPAAGAPAFNTSDGLAITFTP